MTAPLPNFEGFWRPHDQNLSKFVAGLCGCLALVARPLLPARLAPSAVLFAVLLLVGVVWPVGRPLVRASRRATVAALCTGVAAFALVRVTASGYVRPHVSRPFVIVALLAAVAEEAFFRRFLYGALEEVGPLVAFVGSAVLFAIVHVSVYGWWVAPLDLAAGLVLTWQRWSTGRWWPSAVTHLIANFLVVI